MNTHAKWTGQGYPMPQTYPTKGAMPKFNPGVTTLRLEFRFCVAWVAIDHESRIFMGGDTWMPIWDFHLRSFGRVIGPQDMAAADITKMADEWRGAAGDRRMEELSAKTN